MSCDPAICRVRVAASGPAGEMYRWSCHYCAHPACHRSPESLSCYLALIQLTSLYQKCPLNPWILLLKCKVMTEIDKDTIWSSPHSLLVYGPHQLYLKAYCLTTQSIHLFANTLPLYPSTASPILSPFASILNASCDILDRFNFTRIKVSWHKAGRCHQPAVAGGCPPGAVLRHGPEDQPPAVANPESEAGERAEGGSQLSRSVILFHWSPPPVWPEPGVSVMRMRHSVAGDWGMLFARTEDWVWEPLRTLIVRIRHSAEAESCPPCAQNTPVSIHNQLLPTKVAWFNLPSFFPVLSKTLTHKCLNH